MSSAAEEKQQASAAPPPAWWSMFGISASSATMLGSSMASLVWITLTLFLIGIAIFVLFADLYGGDDDDVGDGDGCRRRRQSSSRQPPPHGGENSAVHRRRFAADTDILGLIHVDRDGNVLRHGDDAGAGATTTPQLHLHRHRNYVILNEAGDAPPDLRYSLTEEGPLIEDRRLQDSLFFISTADSSRIKMWKMRPNRHLPSHFFMIVRGTTTEVYLSH